ncbi:Imm7 family immunity protein [Streptomyces sp. NPDC056891]|uniref:Imm7 family immunity protein n=1 Tax=Streptomyces sp. NPDC056891 TaxID=3345961 RepID=UPI0036973AFD
MPPRCQDRPAAAVPRASLAHLSWSLILPEPIPFPRAAPARRDDQDPGHAHEVRVPRPARGGVTEHTEALPSPCIPTIEDEAD